jgi:protein-tyrosine phosphatase
MYRSLTAIDFNNVKRLIFVCSGNICRSPLAEAVAKKHGIASESYGLHCRGGDKADERAIKFAHRWGVNLENHITKNICEYTPQPGDLLVGMEPKHIDELKVNINSESTLLTLAGLWLNRERPYLHDPFNTNSTFFEKCERSVLQSTLAIIQKVSQ